MKNKILIFGIFFFTCHFASAQNYSLDFDGVDDLVTSPVMNDTLNTIEFWVKNNVGINGAAQLSLPFNFSSAVQYISFNNCCSGVSGETITIENNNFYTPSATNQILTSGWHHIAITSNGISYNKIYIDGILANMISTNSPVIYNTKLDLGYRTYANPFGQFPYNGRFDEIRIWKVIRTQTEIQNNMNTELAGNDPNLILYYKMDNVNSPCDIQDCSPFGFNGIRTGVNGPNNRPQFSTDVPFLTLVSCGAASNCTNVSIVSSNNSICNGQSVTITASGGTTYQWSGGSSSTSSTITVSPASTTTYFLQVTNGFVIINDSITIQVDSVPIATVSGNQNICSGQSTMLTASGASSYQWSGGLIASTQIIMVNPSTTTNYIVTPINGGCQGNPDTIAVYVTPMPNVSIAPSYNSICVGQSITLTASGGSTFQWSGGSSSTSSTINVNPTVTTTYYLQSSNGSCTENDSVTIQVDSIPVASISGNQTICSGQSTTLNVIGANSYQWSGGITASTPIIMVSPLATTNYIVTPFNGGCQGNAITVAVNVTPAPTTDAGIDQTIIDGSSITLNGTGGGTYLWNPSVDLDCSNCQNPVANPLQTTTYYLTVNSNGCSSVDSVKIIIDFACGAIFVPSAFSPNGDNENNFECVYGKCIQTLSFAIFDRWGEQVFETNNQSQCWDGTYKGKKLDAAEFVYYLKASLNTGGEEIIKKGKITLIK